MQIAHNFNPFILFQSSKFMYSYLYRITIFSQKKQRRNFLYYLYNEIQFSRGMKKEKKEEQRKWSLSNYN